VPNFRPKTNTPFDKPSSPTRLVDDSSSIKQADQSRDRDLAAYLASIPDAGLSDADAAKVSSAAIAYTAEAKRQDLGIGGQTLVSSHEGEINAWMAAQRRNTDNGIIEIRNAALGLPGLTVFYQSQFGQEKVRYETTVPPTPLPRLEPLQHGGRADYLSSLIAVVFFDGDT
jgi:hypothetical protein